jgi:hypothetical protein
MIAAFVSIAPHLDPKGVKDIHKDLMSLAYPDAVTKALSPTDILKKMEADAEAELFKRNKSAKI